MITLTYLDFRVKALVFLCSSVNQWSVHNWLTCQAFCWLFPILRGFSPCLLPGFPSLDFAVPVLCAHLPGSAWFWCWACVTFWNVRLNLLIINLVCNNLCCMTAMIKRQSENNRRRNLKNVNLKHVGVFPPWPTLNGFPFQTSNYCFLLLLTENK